MDTLRFIAAHAAVYAIWHERNARNYSDICTPVES
ncbi:unnamed protein product, partial [Arabidopsis halleri]